MLREMLRRLFPLGIFTTIKAYRILSTQQGHYRSARKRECLDGNNSPIPWYSYPAIEYIRQLDFRDKNVFEFGSGNSTLFWAQRCRKLVSVEDNQEWYDKIKSRLPHGVEYLLRQEKKEYAESILSYPDDFDIIIIDGNYRLACATAALRKLKGDGLVILDNSDWHEKTSELLRGANLIEVDMSGFGPINGYTWTTSFYFTRAVVLKPAHGRQPTHGIGSLHHDEAL